MTKEEIITMLKDSMEARGVYDVSLNPAIDMLASLMIVYNEAVEAVGADITILQTSREGDDRTILNPAFQAMATTGEQIRKYMRDLGLVVAKPAGFISQEKDPTPKQGDKLMNMMELVSHPKPRLYKGGKKKETEA